MSDHAGHLPQGHAGHQRQTERQHELVLAFKMRGRIHIEIHVDANRPRRPHRIAQATNELIKKRLALPSERAILARL